MRIDEIISSAKYRIDEQFQNLLFFGSFMGFLIEKNLKVC